jgi:hypothetical protein
MNCILVSNKIIRASHDDTIDQTYIERQALQWSVFSNAQIISIRCGWCTLSVVIPSVFRMLLSNIRSVDSAGRMFRLDEQIFGRLFSLAVGSQLNRNRVAYVLPYSQRPASQTNVSDQHFPESTNTHLCFRADELH